MSPELVRSVLDSAPDAMLLIDPSGRIVFANRQVSALFGYPSGELLGDFVETLLPERFRGHHVSHRSSYAESIRVRPMGSGLDLFARRKDGTEFPVEISLSPAGDNDEKLVVAAIRDTTERRRTQTELREAREAADRANQAKSRFLATASHDLRQPMQALSLLNGAMRRMSPNADLADALEQEAQSIEVMSRLLNALLDISKLESGAIKPEVTAFRVAGLFEEVRREFASLAEAKGLALEMEACGDSVHSDMSLVGQIVRNFVSNAIKYTQRGSVKLRCEHERECVRLVVLDTGIGIPATELPHIFEDFYQVGVASNTTREGYGLGLGIVSRIANLLGALLDVTSEPGKGTKISVALPAAAECHAASTAPARANATAICKATTTCVLLVDDDERVRKATCAFLRTEGYSVIAAGSVAEAVSLANAHPEIRLLVTDYHLAAGETGLQVVSELRRRFGDTLPAVMITGDTSSTVGGLGADHRLRIASKPINPDMLLEVMSELLHT